MAREKDAIRLLPLATNIRAALAIDGPASATWNTIIQAVEAYKGPIGNDISLAAVADGTWVPNIGTLTLAGNAAAEVAAELDLDTVTGDIDTIIEAAAPGVEGNDITVTIVGDSGAAEGVTIEEVGNAVTIHFETGVSTIADLETAIGADSDLIAVKTTGTGATVLDAATDECTAESLAGGATETVTIGTTVYSWRDTGKVDAAYDVLIGATASDSIDNLIAAINANGTGDGSDYGAGTVAHTQVRAYAGAGDTMVVHTKSESILTAVGTLIATTDDMDQGSWGAATLADGTNGTNVTFVVTDEAVVCHFAGGYSTVSDFEAALAADEDASALLEVLTPGTTPLYRLVVTDDDFSATNLSGGGDATEAAPTAELASAGIDRLFYADEAMVLVSSEAGSGTMTATVTIWGFSPVTDDWYVAKKLNGGSAIPETATDRIAYSELVTGLGKFTKFAAELATAGTGTEVEVWLDFVRPDAHS